MPAALPLLGKARARYGRSVSCRETQANVGVMLSSGVDSARMIGEAMLAGVTRRVTWSLVIRSDTDPAGTRKGCPTAHRRTG
jgi:hypothetical protein